MLQTVAPLLFIDQFYLGLLCDDMADIFTALAVFFALPYARVRLKLLALAYAAWCAFTFLNNVAVEVSIEHIRVWQALVAVICLGFFGFVAGWVTELSKLGDE